MIDFKTHTLFSKIFLSITLFWIYPSLCLASGTGSIYYLDPMPPSPMSIRTGIEPALPIDGENVHAVEHAILPEVLAASHPAPIPAAYPGSYTT